MIKGYCVYFTIPLVFYSVMPKYESPVINLFADEDCNENDYEKQDDEGDTDHGTAKLEVPSVAARLAQISGDGILAANEVAVEALDPEQVCLYELVVFLDGAQLVRKEVANVSVFNEVVDNLIAPRCEARRVKPVDIFGDTAGSNAEFSAAVAVKLVICVYEFFVDLLAHIPCIPTSVIICRMSSAELNTIIIHYFATFCKPVYKKITFAFISQIY